MGSNLVWPKIEENVFPRWLDDLNLTHFFDLTLKKLGNAEKCRKAFRRSFSDFPSERNEPTVVNDVLQFLEWNPNDGCIIDDFSFEEKVPREFSVKSRSFETTCRTLKIDRLWHFCRTNFSGQIRKVRLINAAIFHSFVDTGSCHPQVPGTIFNPRWTFHFQIWTNRPCSNDRIDSIPSVGPENRHFLLIDALGNYFAAPGHFIPETLPRIIRTLATSTVGSKVLLPKGKLVEDFAEILVERRILAANQIVWLDENKLSFHFGHVVFRSETFPFTPNENFLFEKPEISLLNRIFTPNPAPPSDRIVFIRRQKNAPRSLIEHRILNEFINETLRRTGLTRNFRLEIFDGRGHVRQHIELFNRARVIIGAHGAGLSNVIWAKSSTHVVEIGYDSGMTLPEMYAKISLNLEQTYWLCKGYGDYSKPIHVDLQDFQYIFNEIIQTLLTEIKGT